MPTGIKETARRRSQTEFDALENLRATRRFILEPGSSFDVALPTKFEPHPTKPWLLCLNLVSKPFGNNGDLTEYTATYEPLPAELRGTYEGSEPRNINTARKGITIGGELFSYRNTESNIVWDGSGQPVPETVNLTQRIITGQIRIETETEDFDGFSKEIARRAGKVNSKTFLGFKPEHVLFLGARLDEAERLNDAQTSYDRYWEVELSFMFRVIPLDGGATGGWQYHFDPAANSWDTTTPKTYKTDGTFDQLIQ